MDPRLRDILDLWDSGMVARYEVHNTIVDVIDQANVHEVVGSLPTWIRGEIIEELYTLSETDPEELISLRAGTERRPMDDAEERERAAEKERRDVEMRRRFREITKPAARAWVQRNPKYER